jgi:4-hydroxybenzoate polyprenyltransferase
LVLSLLLALRPKQWTKNVLLYAGFLFTLNKKWHLGEPSMWQALGRATLAMLVFTALASGIYLLNDVKDLSHDKLHPQKRHRPIASGHVPLWLAVGGAAFLEGVGLCGAFLLNPAFGWVAALYVLLQLAYTGALKHMVIIDVFVLASGFVLRAVSGVLVLSAYVSPWLYIVTFLGALFLGLCKRRRELSLLEGEAGKHRQSLSHYSMELLDQMIGIVTASTIMAYSLYTFSAQGLPQNHLMMLTIPHVLYGMLRYLYLVHMHKLGGSPEEILLRDRPILFVLFLWAGTAAVVLAR